MRLNFHASEIYSGLKKYIVTVRIKFTFRILNSELQYKNTL